jgi:hypothetical protein
MFLPINVKSLLGLGLNFCPPSRYSTNQTVVNSALICHLRDIRSKYFFLNEQTKEGYSPRLYVKSKWMPPPWTQSPELERRFQNFRICYRKIMIKRPGKSNLLHFHHSALQILQSFKDTIVVNCTKNCGPACIDIPSYIHLAFQNHLHDSTTYRFLNPQEGQRHGDYIKSSLKTWIAKWKSHLNKHELRFICSALQNPETDPISTLYLLMKVHKSPLKTRPIISCSGTLFYYLGIWVDDKLQKFAKRRCSYFKSSFDLKKDLTTMELPSNPTIFTANAILMYTNIHTKMALCVITKYLSNNKDLVSKFLIDLPALALTEALRLIMTNNIF